MIDFHCHIIPELDDGAADWKTAIEMMVIAVRTGTSGIVATPHVVGGNMLPDWEEIVKRCKQLQTAAADRGIDLRLYPGAEVAVDMQLLEMLTGPGHYCVNGGRYLLVEMPALEIPDFAADFLFRLQTRGFIPVIAHPERHPVLADRPQILRSWIEKGIFAQVNAASLTGRAGLKARKAAVYFLKSDLIQFIGSDGHNLQKRPPEIRQAAMEIGKLSSGDFYRRLLNENPELAVQDQMLKLQVPSAEKPNKGFFSRLFRRYVGNDEVV